MILDSGTMLICSLENIAEKGDMPKEVLVPFNRHWYQERTIGLNRQYLAKGVNERVDLYVYVHEDRKIRIGMYAVLGNGEQFLIRSVHHVIEETTNLRYSTMEMQRLDANYDVKTKENP